MRIDAYCRIGTGEPDCLILSDLLSAMARAEVDMAVVAGHERFQAVRNREGNDALLTAARRNPGRIIPSCSVNPWYGGQALAELDRCHAEGTRLLVLNPACQGFQIDDELVFPLLDRAQQRSMTIYVHSPQGATPHQLALIARKFPDLPWIMGHAGATDYWYDVPAAVSSVSNLYIESSFARPFTFLQHCRAVGFDKGIMGSGAPLNGFVFEWREMEAVLKPSEHAGIYGDTMIKLLGSEGGWI
jgi:uncharacterized protein